ncbi:MAG: hypoxanthine phosphoribosyltransferase [Clostridiales bacterium]|nr:hypoxanthine phosphoribosyltransferase [Clostridiales bacterium]
MKVPNDKINVMISYDEMQSRIKEIANQINKDYKGKSLLVVCILKGAVLFYSDLVRMLDMDVRFDFMTISSYGNSTESTGEVKIKKDLDNSINEQHVLIVEDIVDSGLTLKNLKEVLSTRKPASIKVCCMLDKPSRRKVEMIPDYCCFEIPDKFVVGYGLDYSEEYRQLKDVCFIDPEFAKTL